MEQEILSGPVKTRKSVWGILAVVILGIYALITIGLVVVGCVVKPIPGLNYSFEYAKDNLLNVLKINSEISIILFIILGVIGTVFKIIKNNSIRNGLIGFWGFLFVLPMSVLSLWLQKLVPSDIGLSRNFRWVILGIAAFKVGLLILILLKYIERKRDVNFKIVWTSAIFLALINFMTMSQFSFGMDQNYSFVYAMLEQWGLFFTEQYIWLHGNLGISRFINISIVVLFVVLSVPLYMIGRGLFIPKSEEKNEEYVSRGSLAVLVGNGLGLLMIVTPILKSGMSIESIGLKSLGAGFFISLLVGIIATILNVGIGSIIVQMKHSRIGLIGIGLLVLISSSVTTSPINSVFISSWLLFGKGIVSTVFAISINMVTLFAITWILRERKSKEGILNKNFIMRLSIAIFIVQFLAGMTNFGIGFVFYASNFESMLPLNSIFFQPDMTSEARNFIFVVISTLVFLGINISRLLLKEEDYGEWTWLSILHK